MNFFQRHKLFIVGGCIVAGIGIFFVANYNPVIKSTSSLVGSVSSLAQETFSPSGVKVLVGKVDLSDPGSVEIFTSNKSTSDIGVVSVPAEEKILTLSPCNSEGNASHEILINEVAWAGTGSKNTTHEWIEFFNNTNERINLKNWQLVNSDASIRTIFGADVSIDKHSYLLLERSNDDSVPEISADLIFTGVIRNTNESLTLFNDSCKQVDTVSANPSWPAGESSPSYRTLERGSDLKWHTYNGTVQRGIFGTPRAGNTVPSVVLPEPIPFEISEPPIASEPTPTQTPLPVVVETPLILISEIMAGSEGNSNNEFIELYNAGESTVDLTGWSIKKKTSTWKEEPLVTAVRLKEKSIPAGKYFLIANDGGYAGAVTPDATWAKSNTLAYTSNSIVLYDASGNIIEEVHWDEIPKDQSFMRMSWNTNTFQANSIPTPQNSL